MAIVFKVKKIESADIRQELECVIRECIGARAEGEEWRVEVHPDPIAGKYFFVDVTSQDQRRRRLFFEEAARLASEVRAWLRMYPFR